MIGQKRDVFQSLSQRRQVYGNDVDTVEQIGAETTGTT
jgi:hypothetical protein